MKTRQHKKLCKKSAEIIGFNTCDQDDGVWHVCWEERGMDYTEFDSEEAWGWLVRRYDAAVNTTYDSDSECGISWKPENQIAKATPTNVFAWARLQNW